MIIEKPPAIALEDADRMIEAVQTTIVQLIVGQSQSYEPPIRAIREVVRSQEISPEEILIAEQRLPD